MIASTLYWVATKENQLKEKCLNIMIIVKSGYLPTILGCTKLMKISGVGYYGWENYKFLNRGCMLFSNYLIRT